MAKVYNTRNILDSNMLLNAKQFSREREKTLAGYRKEMAEGLGQLAKAMGSGYDMYQRYKELKPQDDAAIRELESQISELETELEQVNSEISTIENSSYTVTDKTPIQVQPNDEFKPPRSYPFVKEEV